MDEKIATAEKKVLVEIVRLSQKQGMKGSRGDWKEFLNSYDRKFGASLSDPSRRSNDVMVAFLQTFTKEDDLKFFSKVIQCHERRNITEKLLKRSPDEEFPEQKLVRLTLGHPHYPSSYSFPSHEEGWVVTKLGKKSKGMRSNSMLAVDCEMVLCEDGSEALVRVCVVDQNLQVKLDELVNPKKAIADYRTEITGISSGDLDKVTCSLADVQESMLKLLSNGTVLIGHSLNNDLQALKIDHVRVVDTSLIFKDSNGPSSRRPSLNKLCKSILGYEVRKKGAPHNCLDDAQAAMKLILAKIDRNLDDAIPLIQDEVPEIDMSKLLLHRIPTSVPSEALSKAIPGNFTIELKPLRKGRGEQYSAFAIFRNAEDAHQAFENLEGSEEKDSSGRPQKLITFENEGTTASLYVRKMACEDSHGECSSKKRGIEVMENTSASKKLKTDKESDEVMTDLNQCYNHMKEIESLKMELKQKESNQCCDHLKEIESLKHTLELKDYEATVLHNIIANLKKRKRGKEKSRKGRKGGKVTW